MPRWSTVIVSLVLVIAGSVGAIEPTVPTTALPATIISAHDADTVFATVHLPFGLDMRARSWRAYGYDTWEVNRVRKTIGVITDEHLVKGKVALADFQALLAVPGTKFYLEDPDDGAGQTYDRTVARFWVLPPNGQWIHLGRWMEERGHLREPRTP